MLFSYQELVKIANLEPNITVDQVVSALTTIGFEVESVVDFAKVENAKFGEVTKVFKNPNGTKLNVCKIKFSDKIRTIQTTAQNVQKGMFIAAFVPGSKVNGKSFEAREIRGIISEGMLTNITEFGVEKELLRPEAIADIFAYKGVSINDDVNTVLGLNDKIIDINILANRTDAASYYVMAMELAAFFKTTALIPSLKTGKLTPTKTVAAVNGAHSFTLVEAQNNFSISLYEQVLLAKHKIKSVNDGVDLANLTMLYSGLPVHTYDASKIGTQIKVTTSSNEVNVLGNTKIKLNQNLVIADENEVLSVASVIGLEKPKVTSKTQNLVFEIGRFWPQEIRKSLLNIKIETLAARQGIKDNGAGMVEHALIYLSTKLGDFSKPIHFQKPSELKIPFSAAKVNEMAGEELTKSHQYKDVLAKLTKLGFEFGKTDVKVPSYRYDVTHQADLNEEIMRFYGYQKFRPQLPLNKPFVIKKQNDLKPALQSQGYSEVRTYTLTSSNQNQLDPFGFKNPVKLKTFVSEARSEIRNSQAISLLAIAEHNRKQGMANFSIFSYGMINNGTNTIALLSSQKPFAKMQSDILHLLPHATFKRLETDELHPHIAATINIANKMVGWIGQVHPRDARQKYMLAEFKQGAYQKPARSIKSYKTKPLKYRDVNIFLKPNEDLSGYLAPYQKAYAVEMIDDYKVPRGRKITVRIYK